MRRILITGGAGFIGSHIALRLAVGGGERREIVCMDNLYRRGSERNVARLQAAGVEFVRGDVRDPAAFPEGPFDVIVWCSAEPSVLAGSDGSPGYLFGTNVVGVFNGLETARRWGAGFLFLSTSRVYPIARLEAHPWRETGRRFEWEDDGIDGITSRGVTERVAMDGARSMYGTSKLAAEMLIEEYRAAYGLRAVVNRCGAVAGPWQFGTVEQGFVALWVRAHHAGRPLAYCGYGGSGKQVRDLLHVSDLSDLIAMQLANFEEWEGWRGNVSGGLANSVSLVELTALCREIVGRETPVRPDATSRPNDLRLFIGDSSRLFGRTAWRPGLTVERIVRDTFEWVRDQPEAQANLA